jgi:hypothetical protein
MQNQVQQQPEQQQFQPQMHMQLAGSGAMAASGEKRERGERGERGGVERAAGADGGCVERVSHCVASVHDVHDVSAGAVHAECAAASSVEGVYAVYRYSMMRDVQETKVAAAWSMVRELLPIASPSRLGQQPGIVVAAQDKAAVAAAIRCTLGQCGRHGAAAARPGSVHTPRTRRDSRLLPGRGARCVG